MKKQKLFISILTVFFVCFMGVAFSGCGEEHTHSYTQQITTQATCTEKGVITYTCSCSDTFTVESPALGHDEETHQAQAPTCTEIGWNAYATCEREGCDYSTYEELPATGVHTWDDGVITTKPTCTTKGVKTFTCTVCTTATYTEDINALDHEFTNYVSDNNAKCGVNGTETATCNHDGCNEKDTRTDEDSALDHEFTNYVSDNNATYEKDGTKTAKCNHEGCLVTDTILDENTRRMEKIIILDASASMRTTSDGTTRFERAVWEIFELSDNFFQENGTISLILADNTPEFIAERSSATERETFFSNLDDLLENDKCSYGSADIKSAMALAETILKQNANAEIILYTGTNYQTDSNVKIINVSEDGEWNVAILDANTTVIENYYMLEIDLACYARSVVIQLNVEVRDYDSNITHLYQMDIMCLQNQEIKVVFINEDLYSQTSFNQENTVYFLLSQCEQFYSFDHISISIDENDSFPYDDNFLLYGGQTQEIKTKYASTNPNIFISGALYSLRTSLQDSWDISITETKVGNSPNLTGYDFYIIENTSLTALPTDGAVFLMNPKASSSGFSLGEKVTSNFTLAFDNAHPITSNISSTSATISSYTKISSYDSSFAPIMWCGNEPVCLVKNTPTEKIVVLTVDVGDSNFATTAFPLLMDNIFDYFFPKTIEKDVFNVGEKVEINSTNGTVNLSWYETEIEHTQFPSTFLPSKPGIYTLSQELMSGQLLVEQIFVKVPRTESNISRTEILPQPNQVIVSVTVQEKEESRIVKIEPKNNRIEVGKTTALEVFINSTYEGQATLTLYHNGEKEKSFAIDLIYGSQMFELDYVFNVPGLHEFTFDIVKDDGTLLTKNNNFYAHIYLDAYDNILILERNEGESREIERILLEDGNYQITVLNILEDDIPLLVEELSVYDQVILVNIANADMPEGFDEVLHSYVYDIGGSLFTVGGNDENGEANTYNREDMYGTLYQEMLPVQAIDYTPPIGVVFIVDTSGSMMQTDYSGNTYFDWAKASIVAGLDALTARDFVGIVTLGSEATTILPMTARTQETTIRSAIDSLETNGGNTIYSLAIKQAGMLLLTCEGLAKYHIIMITDGMPADASEYQTSIKNNYENYGITFSIIGIGLNNYNNEELRHAVDLGGGRLYATQEMEILPMLMREELMSPEIKEVNYVQFSIKIAPEYMELFNISIENIPTLEGFYGTKLKDGATAILTGEYGVPIYAQWDYGKGTVGSFMCDLNGTFSENLLNDANGVLLLNKIIGGAFSMPNARIDNNVTNESVTESVVFKAALDNGETLELTLKDENGLIIQTMILDEEADLEKEIQFIVSQIGAYTLEYIQKDIEGNIISTGELLISFST